MISTGDLRDREQHGRRRRAGRLTGVAQACAREPMLGAASRQEPRCVDHRADRRRRAIGVAQHSRRAVVDIYPVRVKNSRNHSAYRDAVQRPAGRPVGEQLGDGPDGLGGGVWRRSCHHDAVRVLHEEPVADDAPGPMDDRKHPGDLDLGIDQMLQRGGVAGEEEQRQFAGRGRHDELPGMRPQHSLRDAPDVLRARRQAGVEVGRDQRPRRRCPAQHAEPRVDDDWRERAGSRSTLELDERAERRGFRRDVGRRVQAAVRVLQDDLPRAAAGPRRGAGDDAADADRHATSGVAGRQHLDWEQPRQRCRGRSNPAGCRRRRWWSAPDSARRRPRPGGRCASGPTRDRRSGSSRSDHGR